MVAELKRTPIEVVQGLSLIEPVTEIAPYKEGGHEELIAEAQLRGRVRLGAEDMITRPELIHPLYRDILQTADIQISNFGLAKTINRLTGDVQQIEIVSGHSTLQGHGTSGVR